VTTTLNDDGRPTSPERISERISETLQLSEAHDSRDEPVAVKDLRVSS
jgi:hypothetical protein